MENGSCGRDKGSRKQYITKLPLGKKPMGCKWIFTIKYNADGSVERHKARLVAKGFTPSYGTEILSNCQPLYC